MQGISNKDEWIEDKINTFNEIVLHELLKGESSSIYLKDKLSSSEISYIVSNIHDSIKEAPSSTSIPSGHVSIPSLIEYSIEKLKRFKESASYSPELFLLISFLCFNDYKNNTKDFPPLLPVWSFAEIGYIDKAFNDGVKAIAPMSKGFENNEKYYEKIFKGKDFERFTKNMGKSLWDRVCSISESDARKIDRALNVDGDCIINEILSYSVYDSAIIKNNLEETKNIFRHDMSRHSLVFSENFERAYEVIKNENLKKAHYFFLNVRLRLLYAKKIIELKRERDREISIAYNEGKSKKEIREISKKYNQGKIAEVYREAKKMIDDNHFSLDYFIKRELPTYFVSIVYSRMRYNYFTEKYFLNQYLNMQQ